MSQWRAAGLLLLFSLGLILGCTPKATSTPANPADLGLLPIPSKPDNLPVTVNVKPEGSIEHDTDDFTQGLLFHKGYLYESTGRNGQSKVQKLDPKTGAILAETPIDEKFFGEGLAYLDGSFYQLTWQAGVCLVFDEELQVTKELFYGSEGWGLTVDPETEHLVFSDGSANIKFLDPSNLISQKQLTVLDGNERPVPRLNELEWVNGEIWANIWTSAIVARIDPKDGRVVGWIDLTDIVLDNQTGHADVLNGLAYDPESDTLWFTGKLWPRIYRVENVKAKFFNS